MSLLLSCHTSHTLLQCSIHLPQGQPDLSEHRNTESEHRNNELRRRYRAPNAIESTRCHFYTHQCICGYFLAYFTDKKKKKRKFSSVCRGSDAITCYARVLLSGDALCALHLNISESSAATQAGIQILQILLRLLDNPSTSVERSFLKHNAAQRLSTTCICLVKRQAVDMN